MAISLIIKAFGKIKKFVCLFTKYVRKALCFVFLFFLRDNLILQKCLQSLCENTVILCVNLIHPIFFNSYPTMTGFFGPDTFYRA